MRSLIVLVVLLAATCMLSVGTVSAAEKAATDKLPAALKALGAEKQVVTVQEAKKVRGQWIWFNVDLAFRNYYSEGYISTEGSAWSYLNIYVDPWSFQFEAY